MSFDLKLGVQIHFWFLPIIPDSSLAFSFQFKNQISPIFLTDWSNSKNYAFQNRFVVIFFVFYSENAQTGIWKIQCSCFGSWRLRFRKKNMKMFHLFFGKSVDDFVRVNVCISSHLWKFMKVHTNFDSKKT